MCEQEIEEILENIYPFMDDDEAEFTKLAESLRDLVDKVEMQTRIAKNEEADAG